VSNQSIEILLIQGPDGSLSAGIAPGSGVTFEQASAALKSFFAAIGTELPIADLGQPEKHIDDRAHRLAHRLGASHHS